METKPCKNPKCDKPCVRRIQERAKSWAVRKFCSRSCARTAEAKAPEGYRICNDVDCACGNEHQLIAAFAKNAYKCRKCTAVRRKALKTKRARVPGARPKFLGFVEFLAEKMREKRRKYE